MNYKNAAPRSDDITVDIGAPNVAVNEADEYSGALPGLTLDVVRTGPGYGPNIVRADVSDEVAFASAFIQFPVFGRTTVADDAVIIALVSSAPPSSRWCGIDIVNNSMLLYGPGTEHTGVSPAGLSFSFASIGIGTLEEAAERREIALRVPARGEVVKLDPTPEVESLTRLLRPFARPLSGDGSQDPNEDILYEVSTLLSGERPASQRVGRRVSDSRCLVKACIDHVDATWEAAPVLGVARRPRIRELCDAVHVSERRLRNAFYDTFGIAPVRYFRLRAMTRARCLLLENGHGEYDAGIALDSGYANLSRFASYYKDVFDEFPSETVASA